MFKPVKKPKSTEGVASIPISSRSENPTVGETSQPRSQEGFFADEVTASSTKPLPLGPWVTTGEHLVEVRLGGLHRVVMNKNTSARFGVASAASQKNGYTIDLRQGELYVEVVPGHPFTVKTPNALLAITGTKFDVKIRDDRTDLVLVEGSIQLSGVDPVKGSVVVSRTTMASVVGTNKPTLSQAADLKPLVLWAMTKEPSPTVYESLNPIFGRESQRP